MNDEHGHTCTAIFDSWPEAVSWAKGVPVVARDETSDNDGVGLEHCACCGQQFGANHLDHDTLTCQNCINAAVDLYHSQGEAAELRAAIREWVEATDDAEMFELDQSNAYGTDHADAEDRVEAAVKALRALAASEDGSPQGRETISLLGFTRHLTTPTVVKCLYQIVSPTLALEGVTWKEHAGLSTNK